MTRYAEVLAKTVLVSLVKAGREYRFWLFYSDTAFPAPRAAIWLIVWSLHRDAMELAGMECFKTDYRRTVSLLRLPRFSRKFLSFERQNLILNS